MTALYNTQELDVLTYFQSNWVRWRPTVFMVAHFKVLESISPTDGAAYSAFYILRAAAIKITHGLLH